MSRTYARYRSRSAGTASSFERSGLPVVEADERIEIRACRRPPPNPRPPAFAAERLVEVVRQDVKLPVLVPVDAVVAGPRPVAVAVDERDVEREEPQRAVDVEDRLERRLELRRRRLVQHLAQLDERRPRLRRRPSS